MVINSKLWENQLQVMEKCYHGIDGIRFLKIVIIGKRYQCVTFISSYKHLTLMLK